jgi:hypothetical protein
MGLLTNPPKEPTAALEIEAAVTTLDRARVECHQKRLLAITDVLEACFVADGDPEAAEVVRGVLDTRLSDVTGTDDEGLHLVERLNEALGGGLTVNSTIGELLA